VRGIDFAHARVIVEFGVGTGCVTREILRRMRPDARLVAVADPADPAGFPQWNQNTSQSRWVPL